MMKSIKRWACILLTLVLLTGSVCVSVTAANAPKKFRAACADGALVLRWNAVAGAESYVLLKQNARGEWIRKNGASPTSTTFTDAKVKDAHSYNYRVYAVVNGNKGAAAALKATYLAPPQITKFVNRANGIQFKWKRCAAAAQYTLYRLNTRGAWERIATLGAGTRSYLDRNVTGGTKYTYTLRQTSGSTVSAFEKNGFRHVFVSPVTGLTVKNSPKGVILRWNAVAEAKTYEVLRKVPGGSWTTVKTVKRTTTQMVDAAAPYGKKCFYLVRALRPNNVGANGTVEAVFAVDPTKPMIALTYDDGPYRPTTNQVLDVLEKYNARATFFVVGNRLATYSDCLAREASLGCEIGCHTYNHTTLTSASDTTIANEIANTNALIAQYSGQTPRLLRAPGGAINSRVQSVVGYPLIQWSVDTRDWEHRNTQTTINHVKTHASDGAIVLMHDIHAPTANAAEGVVSYLVGQGYQLVTVSEMMDAKGITMQNGNVYYRAG